MRISERFHKAKRHAQQVRRKHVQQVRSLQIAVQEIMGKFHLSDLETACLLIQEGVRLNLQYLHGGDE